MNTAGMLAEAFDRVGETVHAAVEGLTPDDLNARVDARANSISWLIWHLTRVQDDHIADAAGTGQIWLTEGWADRFGLPFDGTATGYGHSSAEVAAVRVDSAEPSSATSTPCTSGPWTSSRDWRATPSTGSSTRAGRPR